MKKLVKEADVAVDTNLIDMGEGSSFITGTEALTKLKSLESGMPVVLKWGREDDAPVRQALYMGSDEGTYGLIYTFYDGQGMTGYCSTSEGFITGGSVSFDFDNNDATEVAKLTDKVKGQAGVTEESEQLMEEGAKTFSQWYDETMKSDDPKWMDEFYPFSNYIKVFPTAATLKDATAEDIRKNASTFYSHYPVDSADREYAFNFASEELNIDYDELYYAWLNGPDNEEDLTEGESSKDDIIWKLTDKYEAGELTADDVKKELTKIDNGDESEIEADFELITKGSVNEAEGDLYSLTYVVSEDKSEAESSANSLAKEFTDSGVTFKVSNVDDSTFGVDFIGSKEAVLKVAKEFKPISEYTSDEELDTMIKPYNSLTEETTFEPVEDRLFDLLSVSGSYDKSVGPDAVQVYLTDKGNYNLRTPADESNPIGKDIITVAGSELVHSEDDEIALKDLGYFNDYSNMLMRDEGNLTEGVIPASNLDFAHQELAVIQAEIEKIAGLKSEDTANDLYTDLLEVLDKAVEILSDHISEQPVGTVVGNDSTPAPMEEPVGDIPMDDVPLMGESEKLTEDEDDIDLDSNSEESLRKSVERELGDNASEEEFNLNLMWSAVCSDNKDLAQKLINDNLVSPNTRYERFGHKNSFIMGALRNNNYDMVELLKSLGCTILKSEVDEYKSIMAKRSYEDDATKAALDEDNKSNK